MLPLARRDSRWKRNVCRTAATAGRATLLGLTLLGVATRRATAKATPWWPAHGTVLLSGGALAGATSDAFVRRIIALAGGPDAQIVIIPTANPRADTAALRKTFEARGARHVVVLDTRDRAMANSPD